MDSNSLPMAMELETLPRVLRSLILTLIALFVGGFLLVVLAGIVST
jgi:hypothetical protein